MSYCVFETWKQFSAGIFHVPSHLNKKVVDLLKKTLTVDPLKRATVKDIRCSHFVFGPRIYWSLGLVAHVSNFLGSMNGSKLTCPSICFHLTARWTHLWSTRRSYVKCARCVQAMCAVLICTSPHSDTCSLWLVAEVQRDWGGRATRSAERRPSRSDRHRLQSHHRQQALLWRRLTNQSTIIYYPIEWCVFATLSFICC